MRHPNGPSLLGPRLHSRDALKGLECRFIQFRMGGFEDGLVLDCAELIDVELEVYNAADSRFAQAGGNLAHAWIMRIICPSVQARSSSRFSTLEHSEK